MKTQQQHLYLAIVAIVAVVAVVVLIMSSGAATGQAWYDRLFTYSATPTVEETSLTYDCRDWDGDNPAKSSYVKGYDRSTRQNFIYYDTCIRDDTQVLEYICRDGQFAEKIYTCLGDGFTCVNNRCVGSYSSSEQP